MRYVAEVAATGSFTRAAERCHVTQSALSHQLAALERELGQRLFVRSSRGARLTEAGEAFIPHARAALDAAERALEETAAVVDRVVGTLRLGVIPTVTAVDLPGTLASFRETYPHARLELRTGNSAELVASIQRGELDIAFLGLREGTVPERVASRALSRERLVLVLPAQHPLSVRTGVTLADLSSEVFADFPTGTTGRAQGDAAFENAGVKRDVAFEADTATLTLGLVSAGLAVALLPSGVVAATASEVKAVPVVDGPVRVEYVAWNAQAPRTVARAFLTILEKSK